MVAKRVLMVGLCSVSMLVGTACGGDEGDGGEGGAEGADATLKVASSPIGDVAPLFLGVEEGFFEQEGLTIEEQFVESGAVVVPAVVRGSVQAGFANSITVLSAQQQGLGLRILGIASSGGETSDQGYEPLVVAKDSGIVDAQDLEGGTIAISSLDSIDQIATMEALEKQGADLATIEFIEVPRPDMLAALDAGRVDAATLVEPFAVQAEETGEYETVLDVFADAAENIPVAVYFTTEEYASSEEDLVSRFSAALQESLAFSSDNPDAIREIIPTYTEISPELAESMLIPEWVPPSTGEWDPETAEAQMTMLADLAVKHGVLTEVPDMGELFASYPE